MPSLRKSLQELISGACQDKRSLTTRQLKDLFKLGLSAIHQTTILAHTSEEIRTIWEPAVWNEIRGSIIRSKRLKSSTALQNMCQQMAQHAGASPVDTSSKVATKRRAEDVSDEGSENPRARKKKFKQKKS
jgi:DNA polymerase phi